MDLKLDLEFRHNQLEYVQDNKLYSVYIIEKNERRIGGLDDWMT